jgi:hypothetical protein
VLLVKTSSLGDVVHNLPVVDDLHHAFPGIVVDWVVEQAFAELNGAHIKFVEDAARLLYRELGTDKRIVDFQVACAHLESLHSHDAVSVICKGMKGGFTADFSDFQSLIC